MNRKKSLNKIRQSRVKRVRSAVSGTKERPRLSVFRSNKAIYAQLIDDVEGKTLIAASSRAAAEDDKKNKTEKASAVGELIAKSAVKAGINKAVFDRRSYKYHGRVKSLAEGARRGGLKM